MKCVDWIHLAQDSDHLPAFVNIIVNPRVHKIFSEYQPCLLFKNCQQFRDHFSLSPISTSDTDDGDRDGF
jgi:hypothetical protein